MIVASGQSVLLERFSAMKNSNGTYYTTVIEDIEKGQVIGAATLAVEKKFIHNCATVRDPFHLRFH